LSSPSSTALTEQCLAAARDPSGEGGRVYTELFEETALEHAKQTDSRLAKGHPTRALEGLPISVKDLFDIAGSVTDDDAKKQYPQGWKAPKPYLRIVPQPR